MIESVLMCTVVCDNCKTTFENSHSGFTAFVDEEQAKESAENEGWHFKEHTDLCFCPNCHEVNENDELVIKKAPDRRSKAQKLADEMRAGTADFVDEKI